MFSDNQTTETPNMRWSAPAIALRLQSTRPVGRVIELGSFGQARQEYTRHDLKTAR